MQIYLLNLEDGEYEEWLGLLGQAGLRAEANLDEVWGLYEAGQMIATGAREGSILKCLAVREDRQGTKAFDLILAKLLQSASEYNQARKKEIEEISKMDADIPVLSPGWDSIFVYTTAASAQAFSWFGFTILEYVDNKLVFMEKAGGSGGLKGYLEYLQTKTRDWLRDNSDICPPAKDVPAEKKKPVSAIVMNANPFTLGHLHLVKTAAEESELVHLFILSEENQEFSSFERLKMVVQGTSEIPNLLIHPSSSYLVSAATFPAYFLKDEDEIILLQAKLDARLFLQQIAPALGIKRRYLGTEVKSHTTALYNQALAEVFANKLELKILARKMSRGNEIISASLAREYYKAGKWRELSDLVPFTTFLHLRSTAAGKHISIDEQ